MVLSNIVGFLYIYIYISKNLSCRIEIFNVLTLPVQKSSGIRRIRVHHHSDCRFGSQDQSWEVMYYFLNSVAFMWSSISVLCLAWLPVPVVSWARILPSGEHLRNTDICRGLPLLQNFLSNPCRGIQL